MARRPRLVAAALTAAVALLPAQTSFGQHAPVRHLECWSTAQFGSVLLCASQGPGARLQIYRGNASSARWAPTRTTGLPTTCDDYGVPLFTLTSGRDADGHWHAFLNCAAGALYESVDGSRWHERASQQWELASPDSMTTLPPQNPSDRSDLGVVAGLSSVIGVAVYDPAAARWAMGTPTYTRQFLLPGNFGAAAPGYALGYLPSAQHPIAYGDLILNLCTVDLDCDITLHDFGDAQLVQSWLSNSGALNVVYNPRGTTQLVLATSGDGRDWTTVVELTRVAARYAPQRRWTQAWMHAATMGDGKTIVARVGLGAPGDPWLSTVVLLSADHGHTWSRRSAFGEGHGPWNCGDDTPTSWQAVTSIGQDLVAEGGYCSSDAAARTRKGEGRAYLSQDLGRTWRPVSVAS
jgi:hypothetical protein